MRPELLYELDGRQFRFTLDKDDITIGRDSKNDVVIKREWVSRRHARVYVENGAWRVTDLGSLNGTRVNDLGHTDTVLSDGDIIYLQRFPVTFRGRSAPLVSLTGVEGHEVDLGMHTVVQTAVDFSALASSPPSMDRLRKLLSVVSQASKAILASTSLDETFNKVLDLVFSSLPVERGFIMVWDDEKQDLVARCVKHKGQAEGAGSLIRFSRTIAEKVYRDKVAVLTTDAQADGRFADGASVAELGIRSALAAPLWHGDRVDGLIYVDALRVQMFDKFDLDLLSALGNHVAVAIEQWRLQSSIIEEQVARRRLARYHSPAVVELITSSTDSPDEMFMAHEQDATVLFADVVDFTGHCENREPREIAELLNHYFSVMVDEVFEHQGTLDKFIGDCIMAVFGAPLPRQDHPQQAALAALGMREALERLNESLPPESRLRFRVGLHSGNVVAGNIGSARRTDYTVLGATVNLASRLEDAAEPGQIVISETTRRAIGDEFVTRSLGRRELKGISGTVACYELVRSRGTSTVEHDAGPS